MNRGWVRLYRKCLENGWLQNPALWTFWCYCLLRANHKKTTAKVGFQNIGLEPGEFIFGRVQAAADLKMSEWKIRSCLKSLKRSGNLTIKTTNKFSIITIVNWTTYQVEQEAIPPAKPPATHQQPTTDKNDENDEKEPPANFSSEIFELKSRYRHPGLLDQVFDAIRSTRKTRKVADSIVRAQLRLWSRFPVDHVEAGIRTYIEKGCAAQGKNERYLFGIIRQQQTPRADSQKPVNRQDWF